MRPLDPSLYNRLVDRFGKVLIANEGEQCVTRDEIDYTGVRRSRVVHCGEEYRVQCPKCNDTRFRLYIGHRFAEFSHLAYCFNEDCYDNPAARMGLYGKVFHTRRPPSPQIKPGRRVPISESRPRLPENLVPLTDLAADHPAAAYLSGRGFDLAELTCVYGVAYRDFGSVRDEMAQGRIVVPIETDGRLAGWQARFAGDQDWKSSGVPKYYTLRGMKVSTAVYNLDRARAYPWVIVVEGVSDVWAAGRTQSHFSERGSLTRSAACCSTPSRTGQSRSCWMATRRRRMPRQ